MKKISYIRKCLPVIAAVALLIILVLYFNPMAFMKDGLITRTKVDTFDCTGLNWGATRRHDPEIDNVYLFYVGFQDISVHGEKTFETHDVEVHKILPFLYKWEREYSLYQVSVGDDRYYYSIAIT